MEWVLQMLYVTGMIRGFLSRFNLLKEYPENPNIRTLYYRVMPSQLLYWNSSRWGKRNTCKLYEFFEYADSGILDITQLFWVKI